jgi:hypothetical protein
MEAVILSYKEAVMEDAMQFKHMHEQKLDGGWKILGEKKKQEKERIPKNPEMKRNYFLAKKKITCQNLILKNQAKIKMLEIDPYYIPNFNAINGWFGTFKQRKTLGWRATNTCGTKTSESFSKEIMKFFQDIMKWEVLNEILKRKYGRRNAYS